MTHTLIPFETNRDTQGYEITFHEGPLANRTFRLGEEMKESSNTQTVSYFRPKFNEGEESLT